jgi:hypothetical protein
VPRYRQHGIWIGSHISRYTKPLVVPADGSDRLCHAAGLHNLGYRSIPVRIVSLGQGFRIAATDPTAGPLLKHDGAHDALHVKNAQPRSVASRPRLYDDELRRARRPSMGQGAAAGYDEQAAAGEHEHRDVGVDVVGLSGARRCQDLEEEGVRVA